MKKFSIITVVYNGESFIEETISSVEEQTFDDYEYIIIDGASTDRTLEKIKYSLQNKIVISENDEGIYDAMNKGINLASGEYTIFMNAGDTFSSRETLAKMASECTDDVIFGDVYFHFDGQSKVSVHAKGLDYITKGMPFVHQSTFVKTSLLKKEQFDLKYKIASDYDLFWRLYVNNAKFKYVKQIVANFRAGGVSDNNPAAILECSKIVKKYSPDGHSYMYFMHKYVTCFIKYNLAKIIGQKRYALIRKVKSQLSAL